MELETDDSKFENDKSDVIRLVNNAFAHLSKEAYMHKTGRT